MRQVLKPDLVLPNLQKAKDWNKSDVRGALLAFQGSLCLYCGSWLKLDADEDGSSSQTDHFRPHKADGENHQGYLWLAYDWHNLFLSCDRCNNLKSNHFPLMDDGVRKTALDREPLSDEKPLFVYPAKAPKDGIFKVEIDPKSLTHQLIPEAAFLEQGNHLLEHLHLNSRKGLSDKRNKALDKASVALHHEGDFRSCILPWQPFSWLVCKAFPDEAREVALPEADLFMLRLKSFADLLKRFNRVFTDADPTGVDTQEKRKSPHKLVIARVRMALAVLWLKPPSDVSQDLVKAYLTMVLNKSDMKQVQTYHTNLEKVQPSFNP